MRKNHYFNIGPDPTRPVRFSFFDDPVRPARRPDPWTTLFQHEPM